MSFQGQPTAAGTYRVKQYNGNSYWKYVSDGTRWIQLDSLDKNSDSDLFKVHCFYHTSTLDSVLIQISQWNIVPVSSGDLNVFTISPASDTSVGFFFPVNAADEGKYWGYGFAKGRVGLSDHWRFKLSADGNYSTYGFSMFFFYLALTLPIASMSKVWTMFWTAVITLSV